MTMPKRPTYRTVVAGVPNHVGERKYKGRHPARCKRCCVRGWRASSSNCRTVGYRAVGEGVTEIARPSHEAGITIINPRWSNDQPPDGTTRLQLCAHAARRGGWVAVRRWFRSRALHFAAWEVAARLQSIAHHGVPVLRGVDVGRSGVVVKRWRPARWRVVEGGGGRWRVLRPLWGRWGSQFLTDNKGTREQRLERLAADGATASRCGCGRAPWSWRFDFVS
jgi:hypothetical protein